MAVSQGQVDEVGTARFRYAQGVECEQTGQHVVVATGQPGLDKKRAELSPVETEPGRLLRDLRTSNVHRRGVFDQLLLDASHGSSR